MKFVVADIYQDVIFGKKWTEDHMAVLDCTHNRVDFWHKGNPLAFVAIEPKKTTMVSINSIERDLKQGAPVFAIKLHCENKDSQPTKYPKEIEKILREFKDVFPKELPKGLPPKRSHDFHIELSKESAPQKRGLYRMSQAELEEVKLRVEELLEHGWIRPSKSPWAAPVLFVTKKDGGLRFCIDYRALNRLTIKNSYPLPRIDDILDLFSKAKFFTKIDLRQGYYQIRLDEESIPYTAFNTRYGHFEFLVLPFGLTNAPATFMSLMNDIFRPYLDKFISAYLDDILIYSNNLENHLRHLRLTLNKLREHKLYAKLSKCQFAVQEVEYLGFLLKPGGVCINPSKIDAIKSWEVPKSKRDVQSFMGMINYFRRFIKDCSKIAKPLTELTKNVEFVWDERTEKAFEKLKQCVTTAPVLKNFCQDSPVIVTTDASKYAIGAVLEQDFPDGRHPVAFLSRTLNPAEQNYAAHDSELLAIVDTLRAWRCYLHGRKFIVHSDHAPLKYLQTQDRLSPRQVRWVERLAEFDFEIVPIKGKSNTVADAISRKSSKPTLRNSNYAKTLLNQLLTKTFHINAISTLQAGSKIHEDLTTGYENDPDFKEHYRNPQEPYELRNNLLFYKNRLCVPRGQFKENLIHDYHTTPSAGHMGEDKTRLRIQPLYYWKNMRLDIENYVKGCRICQQTKSRNHKPFGFLQPIAPPSTKWRIITMDFITPLPKTSRGHTGILNVVCKLSKMIRLIPLEQNSDAPYIAMRFKEHIYRNHGLPDKIISDRDSIFMSKFWDTLFTSLKTKLAPSTAYHPETDGQTEIANRKVEEMIRSFTNFRKDNWDEHLVDFEVAYNSAVHSTTLCTPFYLNYGIHPKTVPLETITTNNPTVSEFLENTQESAKYARDNIMKQNEAMAKYANKSRKDHNFKVGHTVWLSTQNLSLEDGSGTRKLNPKFCGPFKITEKINDVTFRLGLSEPMKARRIHDTFHVNLLKPFVSDQFGRDPGPEPPIEFPDGHQEYEVEKILSHRKRHKKTQYLVKWKGYPDHENTWQNTSDLTHSRELLDAYNASSRRSS